MPRVYDWYAVVDGGDPLEQGDFLDAFPVVVVPQGALDLPRSEASGSVLQVSGGIQQFEVVLMTQSCDLPKLADEDAVILCERIPYTSIGLYDEVLATQKGWERLRKGQHIDLHLLGDCDLAGHCFPHQVVNLRRVFTSPIGVVRAFARGRGTRVRLCPPYREHLSQAFARKFMRVGLPVDLPERSPYSAAKGGTAC